MRAGLLPPARRRCEEDRAQPDLVPGTERRRARAEPRRCLAGQLAGHIPDFY